MLNELLPPDRDNDDTEGHQVLREQMTNNNGLQGVVCLFALEEIKEAIMAQKPKKAAGPDKIKSEVPHCLVEELSPYLCGLYNEC